MMMKIFAALAVIAIAVSAETYNYTVPELPCAYQLKLSARTNGGEPEETTTLARNDEFLYMKMISDDEVMYAIYRPDITKKEDDKDMIGFAASEDGVCNSDYAQKSLYQQFLDSLYRTLFESINSVSWDSENETYYEGKKCTLYYNSAYGYSLYVYEDYPYVIAAGSTEQIYEWKWEAPLDKFKLEECEGDFAKTPEAKYSKCTTHSSSSDSFSDSSSDSFSDSSSHKSSPKSSEDVGSSTQAFVGVVFAVIAASLVAFF